MISDSWRKDISCLVYPWDMFLREVFLRTIIQSTNHLKGTRGIFPGGYCQEPIIFGIIFQEQLSREQLSGGNFPRWQLSGGQFSLGAIIVGGNCPGDNNPGGEGTIMQRAIVWGTIIQGAMLLGGNCPGTFKKYVMSISRQFTHFAVYPRLKRRF